MIAKGEIDLPTLIEKFGSEDRCRDYLEALRWPEGVRCPRCESTKLSRVKARHQYDCDSCRYQFSVKAGTVFHDSHLPLWKWFLAVYVMCESKKGVSANQLKRMLGVSYKTAWYLTHRIRWAMGLGDHQGALEGVVEVDETYVGGYRRGARGHKGKTMILGAIERGGDVHLKVEAHPYASTVILRRFVEDVTDGNTEVVLYTDQHPAYPQATGGRTHESVDHSADEWVRGDVHTQSIESAWSLLKRSIVGSYHQLSVKHLEAYLDEFEFRFNNRENPYLFRDTILRLLSAEALRYSELVKMGHASAPVA